MALNMNTPARELTNATSTAKVTPDINSINGQNVSQTKDREKYNILKATQVLNQNGAAQFTGTTDISSEALNLLGALGCSLIAPNPGCSYSLLNQQTDEETLTNPNIRTPTGAQLGTAVIATTVSPGQGPGTGGAAGTAASTAGSPTLSSTLGSRSINATISFPNANDPFYEVDPGQSESTAAEQQNIERTDLGATAITLAADMAEVNLNNDYDTSLTGFNTSMQ
jgi:hypothetical protein